MNNIMLDLETLGTSPNAAVVAIGACFFDIDTREIGDTLYRILDLAAVVRGGGEMDASTVLWWMARPEDARRTIYQQQNSCTPEFALQEFFRFVADNSTRDPLVWGNGASFDNVILSQMYCRHQIAQPWNWWNDRCYRTVKAGYPPVNLDFIGTKHNAIDDAIHQARTLIEILNPAPAPGRELGAELDDYDPLCLVNGQIEGLLEGIGASEDHEDVIQFLLNTGLPRSTVDRLHKAIVWGDIKTLPDGHPSLQAWKAHHETAQQSENEGTQQ